METETKTEYQGRVKLLGHTGHVELLSMRLEVFENAAGPRAIFTNVPPGEGTLAEVGFHYGQEIYYGSWHRYVSAEHPDLPDPSFDPEAPIWINVCNGFREIEE